MTFPNPYGLLSFVASMLLNFTLVECADSALLIGACSDATELSELSPTMRERVRREFIRVVRRGIFVLGLIFEGNMKEC